MTRSCRRSVPFWRTYALGIAICVGAARAECQPESRRNVGSVDTRPPRVHRVIVRLDGCRNVPTSDVFVIINDRDGHEIRLQQEGSEWTVNTDPFWFDLKGAHASVRFGNARTDCRPASADANGRVARFIFTSCPEPVQRVMISTDPGIPFVYVRELESGQPGSVPCSEQATFTGIHTVNALQFPVERLRLQLGLKKATKADGLLLFSGNAGAPVFAFSRNSRAPELLVVDSDWKEVAEKIEGGLRLKRSDIINTLVLKSPNKDVSSPFRVLYERTFGNLKTVDVTAVK